MPDHQTIALLINLADSTDRLRSASGFLDAAGIAFERIEAVDGHHSDLTRRPEYDAVLARKRYGRELAASEIGCFLSQRKTAETFLRSGAEFALVMEDDLSMPPDFAPFLAQTIGWLAVHHEGRWDVLNLGSTARKSFTPLTDFQLSGNKMTLCAAHFFPLLCTANLWSRQGAERFLAATGVIDAPVDHFLRVWCIASDRGLAFDRQPVTITGADSTIDYSLARTHKMRTRLSLPAAITKKARHQRNKFRAFRNKARFRAQPLPPGRK